MPVNGNGDESLDSKNKNESLPSEQLKISHQGPVARRSRKVFALKKPRKNNLKPNDYRAVLFMYP